MKIFQKVLLTSSVFVLSSATFAETTNSIIKIKNKEISPIFEKPVYIAETPVNYVGFDTLKITVTGTRSERAIKDVPNVITSYDYDDLNEISPLDWRDLFKYDASISSQDFNRSDGQRTYVTGDKGNINIRGLEGNRVLTLIDGIPIPRFSYGRQGTFAASRLNYFDFNNLGGVEVLKGPGSSLYGSDAMAGVVSLRGLNPDDILDDNQTSTFEISSPYNSQNSAYQPSLKYAFKDNDIAGIFSISNGSYSELNRKTDSKYINDVDGDIESYYVKLIKTNGNTDYNITFENIQKDATTLGSSYYKTEESLDSQKDVRESVRNRVSLGFNYKSDQDKFIDQFSGQVYSNVMENKSNYETVSSGTKSNTKGDLDQEMVGGNLQFVNNFKTKNTNQKLTYGFEINHNDAQRTRDTFSDDTFTGSYKSNPDSDILKMGFYVQDEIKFKNWELIPGIRYDANNIDAYEDDKWYDSATISFGSFADPKAAGKPISKDFSHISPSIAAIYKFNKNLNFYSKYSMGYRAPSWEDLNSSFINLNPGFSYSTVGNPNLKKETSNNYELGLKGRTNKADFGIATFYNKYNNFLDKGRRINGETITYSVIGGDLSFFGGPKIDTEAQVYRTMNVKEVSIYGIEANYKYHFAERNKGLSFSASTAFVEGRNEDDDENLDSVNPFKAVTNFNYLFPNNKFSLSLTNTYVGVPNPSASYFTPTTSSGASLAEYAYIPDSYLTTDLTLKYKSSERFIADLGIYNLFDTTYYQWSDIRANGFSGSDDKAYQRYAQPGISIKAGFKWRF